MQNSCMCICPELVNKANLARRLLFPSDPSIHSRSCPIPEFSPRPICLSPVSKPWRERFPPDPIPLDTHSPNKVCTATYIGFPRLDELNLLTKITAAWTENRTKRNLTPCHRRRNGQTGARAPRAVPRVSEWKTAGAHHPAASKTECAPRSATYAFCCPMR